MNLPDAFLNGKLLENLYGRQLPHLDSQKWDAYHNPYLLQHKMIHLNDERMTHQSLSSPQQKFLANSEGDFYDEYIDDALSVSI